jgi:hypothetical protein
MSPQEKQIFDFIKNDGVSPLILPKDETESMTQNYHVIQEIKKAVAIGRIIKPHEAFNMLDIETLTSDQYKQLGTAYNMTPAALKTAFHSLKKNNALADELGGTPKNEYEFVELQFQAWKTKMTFQEMFTIDTPYEYLGKQYSKETLASLSKNHIAQVELADPKTMTIKDIRAKLIKRNSFLELGYQDKQIDHALEDWKNTAKNRLISEVISDLVYCDWNPNIQDAELHWDLFIESITATNVIETKLIMKHFIWQIKRKMFNLPVDYHNMPVLKGEQGIGKSTIIKNLCKPIEEFVANTTFANITDERKHGLWKNYVLVIDEMGSSTNENIEEIKRKITLDVFDGHIMYSNNDTTIVNKATFIGSTNRELSSMIIDDTGMRRFYQIECLKRFEWAAQESINFLALWQSIDEYADTPLKQDLEIFKSVMSIQDQKTRITLVHQFLLEREYKEDGLDEKIDALKFFQEFQEFEKDHDPGSKFNSTRFGTQVLNVYSRVEGLMVEKKRGGGKKGNIYVITMKKAE